jgi:hypothetical protein
MATGSDAGRSSSARVRAALQSLLIVSREQLVALLFAGPDRSRAAPVSVTLSRWVFSPAADCSSTPCCSHRSSDHSALSEPRSTPRQIVYVRVGVSELGGPGPSGSVHGRPTGRRWRRIFHLQWPPALSAPGPRCVLCPPRLFAGGRGWLSRAGAPASGRILTRRGRLPFSRQRLRSGPCEGRRSRGGQSVEFPPAAPQDPDAGASY